MDRICFHPTQMVEVMLDGKFPKMLKYVFGPIMKARVKERLTHDGIARHTKEEIYQIFEKDLAAIDTYLKDRKPSGGFNIAEAAIFGHLVVVVCCPYQTEGKELIDRKFPLIKEFVTSTLKTYYQMKWKYLLIAALVVALVVETDASKKRKKNKDDDSQKNDDTETQVAEKNDDDGEKRESGKADSSRETGGNKEEDSSSEESDEKEDKPKNGTETEKLRKRRHDHRTIGHDHHQHGEFGRVPHSDPHRHDHHHNHHTHRRVRNTLQRTKEFDEESNENHDHKGHDHKDHKHNHSK